MSKLRSYKKAKKRLDARIADFEASVRRIGSPQNAGYKKPGSMKKG